MSILPTRTTCHPPNTLSSGGGRRTDYRPGRQSNYLRRCGSPLRQHALQLRRGGKGQAQDVGQQNSTGDRVSKLEVMVNVRMPGHIKSSSGCLTFLFLLTLLSLCVPGIIARSPTPAHTSIPAAMDMTAWQFAEAPQMSFALVSRTAQRLCFLRARLTLPKYFYSPMILRRLPFLLSDVVVHRHYWT